MSKNRKPKRVGNQRLYRTLAKAKHEIRMAERHAEWFSVGDLSDGPEALARIEAALSALTRARSVLLRDMDQDEQPVQEPLFEDPKWSHPCAACGHGTVDHREGLRCICGCRTYRLGAKPQLSEGYRIDTLPATCEDDVDESNLCAVVHPGPCKHPEDGEA